MVTQDYDLDLAQSRIYPADPLQDFLPNLDRTALLNIISQALTRQYHLGPGGAQQYPPAFGYHGQVQVAEPLR
ncbi:MAG: hypothetical protein ACO3YX_07280, partial [Candidatus Nanopelagicaceae bacterium]